MRIDAFEAVVSVLAEMAPNVDAIDFVTALANRGYQVTPRQKPKKKVRGLRVIKGGRP